MKRISKEKRSKIMAAIHSKNTKPEIALRDALTEKGLTFETYYGREKIDIAFPTEKIAIFMDGCFWHGCPTHNHKISTNEIFWKMKLEKNIERDKIRTRQLEEQGWVVIRLWEHELVDVDSLVNKILQKLKNCPSNCGH